MSIHENESNVRSYLYWENVEEVFEVIQHRGEVDQGHNIGNNICRKIMEGYVSNPEWWIGVKLINMRPNAVGTLTLEDICKECHSLMTNYAIGAAHTLGDGVGFEKEDKLNFSGSFYYKIEAMVKEVQLEFDNPDHGDGIVMNV
ncbi:hypothetical protein V6N12_063727 [Hibiscus sabdariffa]|uniref:Uncharacterized protein n=1 Tax=Hibiscus sabdariffa TaxID=183260 RepID=A0ABR2FCK2_9ROSI